jgi:hypothetical protein
MVLLMSDVSGVQGKAFELAWRYCWYGSISSLRSKADPGATDVQSLVQECIKGANYYKGLMLQLKQRYDVSIPIAIQLDAPGQKAASQLVSGVPSQASGYEDDVNALICHSLVKIGDLTRWVYLKAQVGSNLCCFLFLSVSPFDWGNANSGDGIT